EVDRSRNCALGDFLTRVAPQSGDDGAVREVVGPEGQRWRLAQRRLAYAVENGTARLPQEDHPPVPGEVRYPALMLTVAVSLEPTAATLRTLLAVLSGLSLGLWLVAAVPGRALGRRALAPVTRMARAARAMGAADLSRRLPESDTADELHDLGRAFNELLGRLQESFERQRRFTSDASHQLRTPLTVMLG